LFCTTCGNAISSDGRFCSSCGAPASPPASATASVNVRSESTSVSHVDVTQPPAPRLDVIPASSVHRGGPSLKFVIGVVALVAVAGGTAVAVGATHHARRPTAPAVSPEALSASFASLKADLDNAATAEETYITDNPSGYTMSMAALTTEGFNASSDDQVSVVSASSGTYCLRGTSPGTPGTYYYDSASSTVSQIPCTGPQTTAELPAAGTPTSIHIRGPLRVHCSALVSNWGLGCGSRPLSVRDVVISTDDSSGSSSGEFVTANLYNSGPRLGDLDFGGVLGGRAKFPYENTSVGEGQCVPAHGSISFTMRINNVTPTRKVSFVLYGGPDPAMSALACGR
jgi:hypothetical protein